MKIAVVMLGNERHKNNDYGFWAIYAALKGINCDVSMHRIDILKNEHVDFINSLSFDIIFVSVYNDNLDVSEWFIEHIKQKNEKTIVVIGGAIYTYQGYPGLFDLEKICNFRVRPDFSITGDPQGACKQIVEYAMGKRELDAVKGADRFCGKGIVVGDKLPYEFEKYNNVALAQADYYKEKTHKEIYVMATLGCTAHCAFCFNWYLFCKGVQMRKVRDVVEEMVECKKKGFDHFQFIDSSLDEPDISSERLQDIAEEIEKRGLEAFLTTNMTCTVGKHSDELLKRIHSVGFICMFVGCEAFNDEDLKTLNKKHTLSDCYESVEALERAGIKPIYGIINYNPYTTAEGLLQNAKAFEKLNLSGSFPYTRKLRVYPGTTMFSRMKKDSLDYRNPGDYAFADENMRKIDEALRYFETPERIQLLEKINFFYRRFIQKCAAKRLKYERLNDYEKVAEIDEITDKRDAICKKYGKQYNEWFISLVKKVSEGNDVLDEAEWGNICRLLSEQVKELKVLKQLIEIF